jgi:2-desacetyl-2-hydroxyethyl bacteriochlorophyllide A dehydrogenase
MRAAVLVAPSTFELRDVEPPDFVRGWQAVDVSACGVCGSDLGIYDRDPPIPRYWPGHEIAGRHAGRLVVVNPLVFCGSCRFCASGRENLCDAPRMISHHAPGGFAERVHAPAANIHPIDATPEHAACVEPVASSLHVASLAGPLAGRRVAVVGASTIGLLLVQLARRAGAERVGLVARHDFQRQLGRRLGAEDPDDFTPDVTLVAAAGDGSGLQWAADHSDTCGRVVLVGNIKDSRPLTLKWIVERELQVVGSQRYTRAEFHQAIRLVESGALDLDALITHRFPLSEIARAYEVAGGKAQHRSVKVLVHPDGLPTRSDA